MVPIMVFEEYLPMGGDKGDKEGGERRERVQPYLLSSLIYKVQYL